MKTSSDLNDNVYMFKSCHTDDDAVFDFYLEKVKETIEELNKEYKSFKDKPIRILHDNKSVPDHIVYFQEFSLVVSEPNSSNYRISIELFYYFMMNDRRRSFKRSWKPINKIIRAIS